MTAPQHHIQRLDDHDFADVDDAVALAVLRLPPPDVRSCRALWLSVLRHGLIEAIRPKPNSDMKHHDPRVRLGRARAWLGSKDFHIVCALCGLDAGYVLRRLEDGGLLS